VRMTGAPPSMVVAISWSPLKSSAVFAARFGQSFFDDRYFAEHLPTS
jgi:hypothetical protein